MWNEVSISQPQELEELYHLQGQKQQHAIYQENIQLLKQAISTTIYRYECIRVRNSWYHLA